MNADMTNYVLGAGLVTLCATGIVARAVWVKFAPDLKSSLTAIRQHFTRSHSEPQEITYPDNVLPFMAPDRQRFLKDCEKWRAINEPTPKRERR